MGARPAHRRVVFRGLLGGFVVASAVGATAIGLRIRREWRDRAIEPPPWASEKERRFAKDRQVVLDPVLGLRPRRSFDAKFEMAPLGGEPRSIVRHHDNLGLIRLDDVNELPGPPRVLLVGDSHLMGAVSNADNAADVLERSLRSHPGFAHAAVLNASCGYYSLYQEVLRARTLLDTLRPQVLVIAVFLGNDFVELDDFGRPHLDDAGVEHPPDDPPPPETTTARRDHLGLPATDKLFWQGLNQACYFELNPARFEPVVAKARRCVEIAEEIARARDLRVVFALVPSYDVVFPDRVVPEGERAVAVVRAGWNARLRDRFRALLDERELPSVDLVDAFRADGRDALYGTDYHIFVEGHRLLAERLLGAVIAAGP